MPAPSLMKEVTLSDLLHQAQTKLAEHCVLEDAMEINEQDLSNIIARSQVQRKLMHVRAAELKEIIDLLQAFADSKPPLH